MKDNEEYEQLRIESIPQIMKINKKIKFKKDLKRIKREAMKNMIDGGRDLFMIQNEDVKNSVTGGEKNYHSDPENQTKTKESEVKEEKEQS